MQFESVWPWKMMMAKELAVAMLLKYLRDIGR
jgi:hypothetical protein